MSMMLILESSRRCLYFGITSFSRTSLMAAKCLMSNPVSRLVPRRVMTRGSMAGWEVRYAYGDMQVSTISTPASMALIWRHGRHAGSEMAVQVNGGLDCRLESLDDGVGIIRCNAGRPCPSRRCCPRPWPPDPWPCGHSIPGCRLPRPDGAR